VVNIWRKIFIILGSYWICRRGSVGGPVTRLWGERSGVQGVRNFSLLISVQTVSRTHPASFWTFTGGVFAGYIGGSVNLTTHLSLVPILRMRGVISLLPLHTFMTWAGKDFTFISSKTTDLHQDSLSHKIS